MQLHIAKRSLDKKCDVKKSRRAGKIPAAIYVRGEHAETILIDEAEFQNILRHVQKGRLSTTKIDLIDESGKKRCAIIKDIQYHITTYRVIHLDFEVLHDDVKVKVNVPIEPVGAVDCAGIKLGGVLRQVIRSLKVQCFPKDIPDFFEIDVRSMAMKDAKKLSDLQIPAALRPLKNLDEVCIVIAKR